ncbi:MAG: hypothetical protein K2O59_16180 [Lachnospiraceae bacterium]|nr:hypothetical protein [Lachnospiraceae bacterium]
MDGRNSLNLSIDECIRGITDLIGKSDKVSNVILEFDDDSYKAYEKQKELLIKSICNVTRIDLKTPDFEQFYKILPDIDFWESIKQIVERRTRNYLNAISYNKLETEEKVLLLKKCFNLVFIERENRDFIVHQFDDEKIAKTLYGIIMESEFAIITLYVSRRRFIMGMEESYGLTENDAAYIWDLFENNLDVVEKHEYHKRMFVLHEKIDELTSTVDEVQEEFDTLLSILSEGED